MPATLCVLNLTHLADDPNHRLEIAHLNFGPVPSELITDPNLIPEEPDCLILYVVAHAIPDALLKLRERNILGNAPMLPDQDFANIVKDRRGDKRTLIIIDACYARSFEVIAGGDWADRPYRLIFGCESHEQAWHTGPSADPEVDPPRRTLLSIALKAAIESGVANWTKLDEALRALLANVQCPSIRDKDRNDPSLADFDWVHPSPTFVIADAAPAAEKQEAVSTDELAAQLSALDAKGKDFSEVHTAK
jgi:hypothetical protein